MAIITGSSVTLDETDGLQNLTSTPAPAGDANDNDILLSSLPSPFSTRLGDLGAPTSGALDAALSGYTGAVGNTGSSAFTVTPAPGAIITDVAFTNSTGQALNGLDSGIDTVSGRSIFLYTDTNNNILLGRVGTAGGLADPSGAIAFAAYIEETSSGGSITGGKIWLVQYQALFNLDPNNADDPDSLNLLNKVFVSASQDLSFSLANAPSGQNLFLTFTKANPTTFDDNGTTRISDPAIIATGKDPANESTGVNISTGDTINTSQAGGPTTFGTNSQMITEQEGIRFTFVTGAKADVTIPNLDQNEADEESNIDFTGLFGARSATFDVVQLQSGKSAQVKITAINNTESASTISGDNFIDSYANDGSQTVNIAASSIKVFSGTTDVTSLVTITEVGDSVLITGVKAGYSITYATATDHNRVLIENGAALNARGNTHADFDIGGFKLLQVSTDTAEIGSKMIFEDDGPHITMNTPAAPDVLEVDESNLLGDATANFADNFSNTHDFGTDGAGTIVSNYALDVKSAGVNSGLVETSSNHSVFLFKEGSQIVGREGTDSTDAGTGDIVFTVSVTAAGVVTLDQRSAVVHPITTDPNDNKTLSSADLITLTRTDTITDGDGDTDSDNATIDIGQALNFRDDGPALVAGASIAAEVDEDGLTGHNVDGTPLRAGEVTGTNSAVANSTTYGSLTTLVNFGADGFGSFQAVSQATADAWITALNLKSQGDDVNDATVVGGLITAKASDGRSVFSLQVNANGTWTYTLLDQLDHPAPVAPATALENLLANAIDLSGLVLAFDKDGDSIGLAAGSFTTQVRDDIPIEFTPDAITLTNTGTASGPEDLNAAAKVGADEPGSIVFVDTVAADDFLRSGTTILKSGGVNIKMTGFGTGTLTAFADDGDGVVEAGETVFTATLNLGTDQYTIDFDRKIDDGSGINFLGAAPVKSGNPTYNIIDNVGGTTLDLLFSGANTSGQTSVNVSTQGAGTGNQTMNPGETLRLDFEVGASLAGSPLGSDFNAGTHQLVNGFSFALSQNTPSGTTGTVKVTAIDADNDKVLIGDADDVVQTITRVEIKTGTTVQVLKDASGFHSLTVNGQTVTGTYAADGKSVIITGLSEGTTGDTPGSVGSDDPFIKIFTADAFKFDAVQITNFSGQSDSGTTYTGTDFDIAPAGVDQSVAGTTFNFDLPVQLTDFDGDKSPIENIHVTVNPEPLV
jgi:hypothetical protein